MTGQIPLELHFLGGRDYVYGPTIYGAVTRAVQDVTSTEITRLKLVMHRFARRQCDLRWAESPAELERPQEALVHGSMRAGDREIAVCLVETERPIERRVPYDEGPIWAACQVDVAESLVTAASLPPGYPPADVVVSMNKLLHQTILPGRRWVVTGFELKRAFILDDLQQPSIRLRSQLGFRHTKSEIRAGGVPLGFVYFTSVSST